MGILGRLTIPALTACLLAAGWDFALAQPPLAHPERVTELASTTVGEIAGTVNDETGKPLEGVVVSALGTTTAFAVSDEGGRYSMRELPPGPYLVRAHRQGFLTERGTIIQVRPALRASSVFTLYREGSAAAPRLAEAGLGSGAGRTPPVAGDGEEAGRSESSLAWRLRRLKRSVLRDAETLAAFPPDDDFSLADPFEFLGRAFEQSARAASAFFADISLDGQVDLLTTGSFDSPADLLQTDRTRSVAFFSVGSNVGSHGSWNVKAAMNQGDLDSWLVSGSYQSRPNAAHRYRAGMSYSLQRYQGGNAAALAAMPDTARNVGTVFAFDEWSLGPLSVGVGGTYGHYGYLSKQSLFSPNVSAALVVSPGWRVKGVAARQLSAPGAQEFLPPSRASWLPPQRTFSPLTREGFRTQELQHYEAGLEHVFQGGSIGVRAFRQQVDNQMVTMFGLRRPDGPVEDLGHYHVGSMGDAAIQGIGVTVTHAFVTHVRGSVEYSLARTQWTAGPPPADRAVLRRVMPWVAPAGTEQMHDLTTSVEAEVPQTATRLMVFYRLNSAFVRLADPEDARGLDGRFEVQVNQSLPFMSFMRSDWEMLFAVRNLFHESLSSASPYDELLVVRAPKRIVGGLTVRF